MLSQNMAEAALSELLCDDDLILMSETIEGLRNKFLKWKETFDSKGLKVNLGFPRFKPTITKDDMPKSKVDPCVLAA